MLCPCHKIELAIQDAFHIILINADTGKELSDIYYFLGRRLEASLIYGDKSHEMQGLESQAGGQRSYYELLNAVTKCIVALENVLEML